MCSAQTDADPHLFCPARRRVLVAKTVKTKAAGAGGVGGRMGEEQVGHELAARPEWSESGGSIQRTFAFKTFVEAMAFVNKAAAAAEAMQHHPDILIRYNKVTMTLSTHDASGVTMKDFELATKMDGMI